MASFEQAVKQLLEDEGGFAKADNTAGAVNYGITARFLEGLGLPHSEADIRAITPERAKELYREHFWNKLRLDKVESQRVAMVLFTLAVNQGPYWPALYAQRALSESGPAIMNTGNIGPVTLGRINRADPDILISGIFDQALGRYRKLAEANPQLYADDLPGWESRLRRVCGIPKQPPKEGEEESWII